MNIFSKLGCGLIGWNYDILNDCGEASHRQFRKLLSAILIMMLLWGTIGYCFADRYINIDNQILKIAIALAFMVIVLCVERVIILTVGKAIVMTVMRVILALCMALLGSCIFDQIIFRNDIEQAIQDERQELILKTIQKRLSIYESDNQRIMMEMDSISKNTIRINEELQNNPIIKIIDISTHEVVVGKDSLGNPIKEKVRNVEQKSMANPLAEQVTANNLQIQLLSDQLDKLRLNKQNIADTVTKEINARPAGFIEELEATLQVVSQSWVSLVFYVILFCFLTFLELFVLTIKMGENKCDYELIVEHQLNLKKNLMQKKERDLIN